MTRNSLTPPGPPIPELSPAQIDEMTTADPEVALITDYLANELPRAEREALEHRLASDADFRDRMLPYLAIWNAPTDLAAMDADDEDDRQQARGARTGAPTGDSARQLRRIRRWQLAAVAAGAAFLVTGGTLGFDWIQRRTRLAAVMAEAPANDGKTVMVGEQGWVLLGPGSTLAYRPVYDEHGVQPLRLDGSAEFRLPVGGRDAYVVLTPSARILVTGTVFRVTVDDPSTTLVKALQGQVVLESRGGESYGSLVIGPGEVGQVRWGQAPRSVP
jgi:ferric-dicitrate binding protein FerR (iron transport regulator)